MVLGKNLLHGGPEAEETNAGDQLASSFSPLFPYGILSYRVVLPTSFLQLLISVGILTDTPRACASSVS